MQDSLNLRSKERMKRRKASSNTRMRGRRRRGQKQLIAQLTHCPWSGYLLANVHLPGYRCPRLVSSASWPCSRRHRGIPWQELVWCLHRCKHGPPRSHSRHCVLSASQRFHTGCRFVTADISHRLQGGGKTSVRQGHCCCSFVGLCIHERWEGLPRCTWLSGVFMLLVVCVCPCECQMNSAPSPDEASSWTAAQERPSLWKKTGQRGGREKERETQMKLKWLSLTVFFIRGLLLAAKTKRSYLATREMIRIAVGLSIHWPSPLFSHLPPLLYFPLFFIQKENLSRWLTISCSETLYYLGEEHLKKKKKNLEP